MIHTSNLSVQNFQAVLGEYDIFLNTIKQKHADIIEEANNNEHKWFELFVDKGNETETVDSGDTFDEAVAHIENHIKYWGADKLFMDIWTNKDTISRLPQEELFSLWRKEDLPGLFKVGYADKNKD